MTDTQPEVLILSGTVGAGKTAVTMAIHDLLSMHEIAHACLDLDQFSYSWPPAGDYNSETVFAALEKVWSVYRAQGISKLVLARVVETREEKNRYAQILGSASVKLCRITASEALRIARLKSRESGEALRWHLHRTIELEAILEKAALEDFVVLNENEPITAIAQQVLKRARWLP